MKGKAGILILVRVRVRVCRASRAPHGLPHTARRAKFGRGLDSDPANSQLPVWCNSQIAMRRPFLPSLRVLRSCFFHTMPSGECHRPDQTRPDQTRPTVCQRRRLEDTLPALEPPRAFLVTKLIQASSPQSSATRAQSLSRALPASGKGPSTSCSSKYGPLSLTCAPAAS